MDKKTIFLYAVGLLSLAAVFSVFNVDLKVFFSVKPEWLALPILISVLLVVVYAWRTKFLLLALGHKAFSFADLVKIEFVNKLVLQTAPAKLNIPAKAIMLVKKCGIPRNDALSVSAFEHFLDLFVLLALGVFGFFVFAPISSHYSANIGIATAALVFVSMGFFVLPAGFYDFLTAKTDFLRKRRFLGLANIALVYIREMRRAWLDLVLHRHMFIVIPIVLAYIALNAIAIKLLFLSIGHNIAFGYIVAAFAITRLFSGISNIPGGFGIREASFVILFGFVGIPSDASFFVAIAWRAIGTLPLLLSYPIMLEMGLKKFD
ncbi:MAG: flippase-like domain-containing protein [Candidatus Diapherotrites archaeon]|nr:flippase-like domain-containing protein [Candidatus Diapherotrites archaeon]